MTRRRSSNTWRGRGTARLDTQLRDAGNCPHDGHHLDEFVDHRQPRHPVETTAPARSEPADGASRSSPFDARQRVERRASRSPRFDDATPTYVFHAGATCLIDSLAARTVCEAAAEINGDPDAHINED